MFDERYWDASTAGPDALLIAAAFAAINPAIVLEPDSRALVRAKNIFPNHQQELQQIMRLLPPEYCCEYSGGDGTDICVDFTSSEQHPHATVCGTAVATAS